MQRQGPDLSSNSSEYLWTVWAMAGLSQAPVLTMSNMPLSSMPCSLCWPSILLISPTQSYHPAALNIATQAFDLGVQELHLQSWGDNVQKLSSVAFDLAGINPKQVVVKLPCTLEGIQVR